MKRDKFYYEVKGTLEALYGDFEDRADLGSSHFCVTIKEGHLHLYLNPDMTVYKILAPIGMSESYIHTYFPEGKEIREYFIFSKPISLIQLAPIITFMRR